METTPKSIPYQPEEDDYDGEELTPGTTDGSSQRDGKSIERKTSNSRSKHSETEQRRRSKINERWSQEPTKLIPWRSNHGHEGSYADQSQVLKYATGHDSDIIQPIANMQSTFGSDFGNDPICRVSDHVSEPISALPPNMPSLPTMYSSGTSILPAENIASQSESQVWHGPLSAGECTITGNTVSDPDGAHESSLTNTSSAHSQRLLKSLTQALQTSGVDLSQANISVQLDVGKNESSNHTIVTSAHGHSGNGSSDQPSMQYREGNTQDSNQAAKRFRTGES